MIFIGLGSNIGDKKANIFKALTLLAQKNIEIVRVSNMYETAPWGVLAQDDFVNAVAEVAFEGDAEALLTLLLQTEMEMGRVRIEKWGPRLIDIDIIDFHRQVIQNDFIHLPHPFYKERDFVLIPLRELEPNWEI
jgi:2-amino-4-hydroxy-6-hydroxymethyldihydropteridine diphosphokinase